MNPKIFDEKKYTKMLKEVGNSSYLCIGPQDNLVVEVFPNIQQQSFIGVVMGTGATVEVPFLYHGFEIPAGSEIMIQRTFRHCEHNGKPHLNADDNVIFPVRNGNIMRLSRTDAPDHYLAITKYGGLEQIAKAYYLPQEKAGPISGYVENGALLPIKMDCSEDDRIIWIQDLTK